MGPDPLTPPSNVPPAAPPPTPPADLPSAPPMPPPGPPDPSPAKAEVTQANGTSSKKPMMIAIIMVLVIAILGIGGFFVFNSMNKQPADEDPTAVTDGPPDSPTGELDKLNSEVEGIEMTDPETDLAEIDKQITEIDATATPGASSAIDR